MEDKGLPTVRDVITKLKSDGIFDNFRKSCVNSIENEVRPDKLATHVIVDRCTSSLL